MMSQLNKPKNKINKVFIILLIVIISILLITATTLAILVYKGKKTAIAGNAVDPAIIVPEGYEIDSDTQTSEFYIYHDGKKYKYNDKVTTILFAGIDKHTDEHKEGVFGTAGQADTIIVMALNTETGKYKLMAVSRDTVVDVNVFNRDGEYTGTEKKQLCLAYAYCDGKEESCENLKRSVSRVFFGIPVNSYAAVDLDVIPILNDQVGGVTVTVPEDLTSSDPAFKAGSTVTLNGKQAETFVRKRDIHGDENQNNLRMERQKIFLTSFIQQTLKLTKEDKTTPLKMYKSIYDYLVTDIDVSMITYYTSIFLKTGFSSEDNMMKVPGKTVGGEKYAEYYTDNEEFFKIILDTYYTEVK